MKIIGRKKICNHQKIKKIKKQCLCLAIHRICAIVVLQDKIAVKFALRARTTKDQIMERIKQTNQAPKSTKSGRTAFFVDIDNICGSGLAPKLMVESSVGAIKSRYRPESTDLV